MNGPAIGLGMERNVTALRRQNLAVEMTTDYRGEASLRRPLCIGSMDRQPAATAQQCYPDPTFRALWFVLPTRSSTTLRTNWAANNKCCSKTGTVHDRLACSAHCLVFRQPDPMSRLGYGSNFALCGGRRAEFLQDLQGHLVNDSQLLH